MGKRTIVHDGGTLPPRFTAKNGRPPSTSENEPGGPMAARIFSIAKQMR